jgi:hypothetical protein
MTDSQARNL